MVVCRLCSRSFKGSLASHLYWQHNTNKVKYQERFPGAEIVSKDWKKNQATSHLGQEAWNKDLTKETDYRVEKQSITQTGMEFSQEHCQHISDAKKGQPTAIAGWNKGIKKEDNPYADRMYSAERNLQISNKLTNRDITWGNKISEVKKEQFKDLDFKNRMVDNFGDNPIYWRKPNKPEIRMKALLDQFFPNQYKYVGDGTVVIGTMRPDFINVDGKKQIIEVYGDYWHRDHDPQDKINYYRTYGFETLVVWEHELYEDITPLIEKVKNLPINSHANAELNSSVNDDKCVETIYSASNKMEDDIVHP